MKCHSLRKKLSLYLDGDLSAKAEKQISEHLADCPACRKEYKQLAMIRNNLSALYEENLPERELWYGIHHQINENPRSQTSSFGLRSASLMGAAVLLVGIFFGIYLNQNIRNPRQDYSAAMTAFMDKIETLEAEYQQMKPVVFKSARKEGSILSLEALEKIEADLDALDEITREILSTMEEYNSSTAQYELVFQYYRQRFKILETIQDYSKGTEEPAPKSHV